jgi:UTP--glucose-1-phosphate uridylyltransferase
MQAVNPDLPKEMLPVGSKPAIQYTVEEGVDAGVERIIVILSPRKEIIRRHLARLDYPITFLYQTEPRGEMDAIALAEDLVGEQSLAICYPDNLCLPAPGALKRLSTVFREHAMDVVALHPVTEENAGLMGNSGRVDITWRATGLYRIERFLPKRAGPFTLRFREELRAYGMMVCDATIFEVIRRARKSVLHGEFTDEPVQRLILEERGWLGCRLGGEVHDIGNPEGYLRCVTRVDAGNLTWAGP